VRLQQGMSLGARGSTGGAGRAPGVNQTPRAALPRAARRCLSPAGSQHGVQGCLCSPDGQSQL